MDEAGAGRLSEGEKVHRRRGIERQLALFETIGFLRAIAVTIVVRHAHTSRFGGLVIGRFGSRRQVSVEDCRGRATQNFEPYAVSL